MEALHEKPSGGGRGSRWAMDDGARHEKKCRYERKTSLPGNTMHFVVLENNCNIIKRYKSLPQGILSFR